MLRQAFEKTARWQKDFKGFTADLTVNVNGKETSGPVMVKGPREVSVQLGDADVQKWAQEQLGMIAVHRGPRSFEESDGKYSLTMEEDGHPFGTKLEIHGSNSFYRIKDNRITQINRTMAHPGMTPFAFSINVEESAVTQDQKNLTTKYTVYYYSPTDGKLNNVESFTDTHVRVDHRISRHPPHHYIRKRRSHREEPDVHESQVHLAILSPPLSPREGGERRTKLDGSQKSFPRSMRVKLEGYVHLARMIDKCRAVLAGTEGEYIYPCPMDDRLMEFAGITVDEFTAAVKANPSDEAVATWFPQTAKAHPPAELDAWNRDDAESRTELAREPGVLDKHRDAVDPSRTDLTAWADLQDLEEGRAVPRKDNRAH